MKNLIFVSALFLALAGCSGMLAGDGYSNLILGMAEQALEVTAASKVWATGASVAWMTTVSAAWMMIKI